MERQAWCAGRCAAMAHAGSGLTPVSDISPRQRQPMHSGRWPALRILSYSHRSCARAQSKHWQPCLLAIPPPISDPLKATMNLNADIRKSAATLCLAAIATLSALCFTAGAQAQMARPMASSASMPMDKLPMGKRPMDKISMGASGPGAMKQSMMGGMDALHKMPMSGDTDKDFAMMMKIHHQGALDVALMELNHGKSPEMKAMAKSIIAAQKKEIAQFDRWLAEHK